MRSHKFKNKVKTGVYGSFVTFVFFKITDYLIYIKANPYWAMTTGFFAVTCFVVVVAELFKTEK